MDAKNETALARELGCTRAAIAQWRRDHLDAPMGRNVGEWREFLTVHRLGRKVRGSAEWRAVAATQELLLGSEVALHAFERAMGTNQKKVAAVRQIRGRMAPLYDKLHALIKPTAKR
jgi:hypothetical protein